MMSEKTKELAREVLAFDLQIIRTAGLDVSTELIIEQMQDLVRELTEGQL